MSEAFLSATACLDQAMLMAGGWAQHAAAAAASSSSSSSSLAQALAPPAELTAAAAVGGSPAAFFWLADLGTALQPSCFDAACQQQKDALLVASLALPLLVLAAAVAYLLRPPPQESLDSGTLIQDGETGAIFEVPRGAQPERDRRGELAWKAISYTPWPVEDGEEGERIRIEVGNVGQRAKRTYVCGKVLPSPSQLCTVTFDRPLGIVFEEDARNKRAVVAGFATGGHAEQRLRNAKLNPSLAASAAMEGDVLRAVTATNIVYPREALTFGLKAPSRSIVLYGADGQSWPKVVAALKKGLVADGPVTLVLERRLPAQPAASQRTAAGAAGAAERGRR